MAAASRRAVEQQQKAMRVVALYDYEPDEPDELAFVEGEELLVEREQDDGWWYGHVVYDPKRLGLFPSNYVRRIKENKVLALKKSLQEAERSTRQVQEARKQAERRKLREMPLKEEQQEQEEQEEAQHPRYGNTHASRQVQEAQRQPERRKMREIPWEEEQQPAQEAAQEPTNENAQASEWNDEAQYQNGNWNEQSAYNQETNWNEGAQWNEATDGQATGEWNEQKNWNTEGTAYETTEQNEAVDWQPQDQADEYPPRMYGVVKEYRTEQRAARIVMNSLRKHSQRSRERQAADHRQYLQAVIKIQRWILRMRARRQQQRALARATRRKQLNAYNCIAKWYRLKVFRRRIDARVRASRKHRERARGPPEVRKQSSHHQPPSPTTAMEKERNDKRRVMKKEVVDLVKTIVKQQLREKLREHDEKMSELQRMVGSLQDVIRKQSIMIRESTDQLLELEASSPQRKAPPATQIPSPSTTSLPMLNHSRPSGIKPPRQTELPTRLPLLATKATTTNNSKLAKR